DPLLQSVRLMAEAGTKDPDAALAVYAAVGEAVAAEAARAAGRPRLATAEAVMAAIVPPPRPVRAVNGPRPEARAACFGPDIAAMAEPQPMARLIGWALADLMLAHPEIVVMGEDVGAKGGVYGVTQRLVARFGAGQVIDTLLDETSILGLAIGMAHNGFVPVPEIQFLAYLHNAADQIRGAAATLPFFSNGQFVNPMVVRIAGLGHRTGFGGQFHNDHAIAALRDIPGLILCCPSDPAKAAMLLRECVRLAREEARVVVFLEPIALYAQRDLMAERDGGWARAYPAPDRVLAFGAVAVHGAGADLGAGTDLAIVSYGHGHDLSRQAQADLAAAGVAARVIDLRWPVPLPAMLAAVAGCGAVLVVDECRRSGGPAEALMAALAEAGAPRAARLTAADSFIATGPAHAATLPGRAGILAAAPGCRGGDPRGRAGVGRGASGGDIWASLKPGRGAGRRRGDLNRGGFRGRDGRAPQAAGRCDRGKRHAAGLRREEGDGGCGLLPRYSPRTGWPGWRATGRCARRSTGRRWRACRACRRRRCPR
ncbi:MAG: alpha-ketoacid dehydrogenase subunit beta, partial [Gemmobacter sp.]